MLASLMLASVLVAIALPVALGLREMRMLAMLRGFMLGGAGALYLLRSDAALARAAELVASDMQPELFARLVTLLVVLIWMSLWVGVVPAMARQAVRTKGKFSALLWALAAAPVLYLVIFVIGPL
ncbi:MAG: hypothetical protein ABL900_15005, partial [Burkholderiaceae bacterium]